MLTIGDRLATPRPWLTEAYRAELAKAFDCTPDRVEYHLDARDRMDAYIAERMEHEGHPFRSTFHGRG